MLVNGARPSAVRALASELALRADFDLDSVADLRLAVDEVCGAALARARPDGELTCRLMTGPHHLEIKTTVEVASEQVPAEESLGWRLLYALTDSVRWWMTHEAGRNLVHIRITKLRSDGG